MVWCGVVWCGAGVVWCGVVWCGVVWCGVVALVAFGGSMVVVAAEEEARPGLLEEAWRRRRRLHVLQQLHTRRREITLLLTFHNLTIYNLLSIVPFSPISFSVKKGSRRFLIFAFLIFHFSAQMSKKGGPPVVTSVTTPHSFFMLIYIKFDSDRDWIPPQNGVVLQQRQPLVTVVTGS